MAQENYDSTASESSNYSSYSFEQFLESQIELKEGNSYTSHEAFVIAVKSYAKQQGTSGSSLKIRNRSSQRSDRQRFTSEERLIPLK
ncbi:2042_t:CDS:2, partial [Gigaspora rosea]